MAEYQRKWEWANLHDLGEKGSYAIYFYLFGSLSFGSAFYLIISWGFSKWNDYRQLKNTQLKAELALLKSKMDPHFFFNTLNNLYGLSVERSSDAPKMILVLSDLMRYTIYDGEKECVPLKNELTYLKQYISLHQLRYQKTVNIQFTVEAEEEEVHLPPLLLVVLLENAFKHGVERLLNEAYLHIHLLSRDNYLEYTVENNFDPEIASIPGIGLKNLRKRLALLFPAKHSLELSKQEDVFFAQLKLNLL